MPLASLPAVELTPSAFAPFGWIVPPVLDGTPFDERVESPVRGLDAGTPRFYILRLPAAGRDKLHFDRITHHKRVDQTLGGVGGKDWFIGVAAAGAAGDGDGPSLSLSPSPPSPSPSLDEITVFRVPPRVFIVLKRGTWHAGPLFVGGDGEDGEASAGFRDFFNAELSDTNITDHTTHELGGWVDVVE